MHALSKAGDYRCAVEMTVNIAGRKLKPLIVHYLLSGAKRFGELGRLIGGVLSAR
ncbi:winged helix-turn-helix transcriptional regulator [Pseudomonas sp. ZS1P83]